MALLENVLELFKKNFSFIRFEVGSLFSEICNEKTNSKLVFFFLY